MKRIVVTSAVSNSKVNQKLLDTIKNYCKKNKAGLIVCAVTYNPLRLKEDQVVFDESIEEYLTRESFTISGRVKVLTKLNIRPTAKRPLTGVISLGSDHNTIVPHPRLHEETIASIDVTKDTKKIMTSGTITNPNYTITKIGGQAKFHHHFGFVVVEIDDDKRPFIRQVSCNEDGSFNDMGVFYSGDKTAKSDVEAIVFGDIHEMFLSKVVKEKGFFGGDSILSTLKPKKVILHDVFDAFTISHHHENDIFRKYQISKLQKTLIEELQSSAKFLSKLTKNESLKEVILVNSNHDNHLLQYVERQLRQGFKGSYKALKKTLELQLAVIEELDNIEYTHENQDPHLPDLFAKVMKKMVKKQKKLTCLKTRQTRNVKGWEISFHGHVGLNGARTLGQLQNRLTQKTISAHSHSAKRIDGWCVVGTSSYLNRGYTDGLSTWSHTHAIIYEDGKVQLITQMPSDGKYQAGKLSKVKVEKIKDVDFVDHLRMPENSEELKAKHQITSPDGQVYYVDGRYKLKEKAGLSDWKARQVMSGAYPDWQIEKNPYNTKENIEIK